MKRETSTNEAIICKSRTHWIILVAPWTVAAIFFLLGAFGLTGTKNKETAFGLLIISIATFVITYLNFKTSQIVLTNKRIYGKTGIIKTRSLSSPIDKIQTVNIETSLLGKILGYSNLTIHCITGIYNFSSQSNAEEIQQGIINTIK